LNYGWRRAEADQFARAVISFYAGLVYETVENTGAK